MAHNYRIDEKDTFETIVSMFVDFSNGQLNRDEVKQHLEHHFNIIDYSDFKEHVEQYTI